MPEKTKRIRVAGYTRVSTDRQADIGLGLEIQDEAISSHLQRSPDLVLTRVYSDPGHSGASLDRPGLAQLLSDAKAGEFDRVLVAKQDRLARDLFVQLFIEKELLVHQVTVESIAEPFLGRDPMATAMRQIIGVFAQLERGRIRERMSEGRLKKASQGGYAGGRPPRGYRARQGRLVQSQGEPRVIRRIWELRHEARWSYAKIADHLNEGQIANPRGKKWYPATVRYIAQNQIYLGEIEYSSVRAVGRHHGIVHRTGPHP